MIKNNKKITESKKIIKLEKAKIKEERRNIKKKKRDKFKKTKIGKFLGKFIYLFSDEKNSYSFSEVFIITIVSLLIGIFACFSTLVIISGGKNIIKLSKELSKFYDAYEVLTDNYYGTVDKEELIDSAISGMVSSVGDQYTSYADEDATDDFDQLVTGTYEGIGCTIQETDDGIKIVTVYEDTPAFEAGLEAGDIIVAVDSFDLTQGSEKLANYITTESDGKIEMTISRDGEEKEFTLKRDKVEIPSVTGEILESNNKKIGYINISIFSSVSAKQFEKKLKSLESSSLDALVIDVRGNSGGYLSSVSDIASMLLPKGKIIYQIEKDDDTEVFKDKTLKKREYPIAILVDGGSASASEILAGVIKESYGGYVVGTTTYGKGTVQQVKKLNDGSMIKYTVENWLTPNGNWINGEGIEPTDIVELSEEYYKNPIRENDNQLQKALELVSK